MGRKAILLLTVIGLVIAVAGKAMATTADAEVKSRFFETRIAFGDGSWLRFWRQWLQMHRAIEKHPRLRRQLAIRHKKLDAYELRRVLHNAGVTQTLIEHQPTHVYTLQIAIYRGESGLRWFLSRYWLRNQMERRKVYASTVKGLWLFAGGEFNQKSDPLYSLRGVVKGQEMTHVRYGVYESVADANRDRKALERYLGLHLQVLRRSLKDRLIRQVWFEPVAGRFLNEWDRL